MIALLYLLALAAPFLLYLLGVRDGKASACPECTLKRRLNWDAHDQRVEHERRTAILHGVRA